MGSLGERATAFCSELERVDTLVDVQERYKPTTSAERLKVREGIESADAIPWFTHCLNNGVSPLSSGRFELSLRNSARRVVDTGTELVSRAQHLHARQIGNSGGEALLHQLQTRLGLPQGLSVIAVGAAPLATLGDPEANALDWTQAVLQAATGLIPLGLAVNGNRLTARQLATYAVPLGIANAAWISLDQSENAPLFVGAGAALAALLACADLSPSDLFPSEIRRSVERSRDESDVALIALWEQVTDDWLATASTFFEVDEVPEAWADRLLFAIDKHLLAARSIEPRGTTIVD